MVGPGPQPAWLIPYQTAGVGAGGADCGRARLFAASGEQGETLADLGRKACPTESMKPPNPQRPAAIQAQSAPRQFEFYHRHLQRV